MIAAISRQKVRRRVALARGALPPPRRPARRHTRSWGTRPASSAEVLSLQRAARRPGGSLRLPGPAGKKPRRAAPGLLRGAAGRLLARLRALGALQIVLLAALAVTLALALLSWLPQTGLPGAGALRPIDLPGAGESATALSDFVLPAESLSSGAGGGNLVNTVRMSTHTVRAGDTLSAIAARFNVTMDTVISFNGIQDARSLKAGATLTVPSSSGLRYRVRRGDSLEAIARSHGVALNDLLDWNNLDSALIVPGQELFVPGARLSEMDLNRVFGRLFIFPARGRMTSAFGLRADPMTGVNRFHNGVDMANAVGTPIVAAMSGQVAMLGYNPNFGKYIILSHPEGFQTLYGHLDAFHVRRGERVRQGQQIGAMGNSGYSTGSHLHFSIFRRGEPVDPMRYLH